MKIQFIFQFCLIIFTSFCFSEVSGQIKVKIQVFDENQLEISRASILVKNKEGKTYLYGYSDSNGLFDFVIPSNLGVEDVEVEIRHLSYQNKIIRLIKDKFNYEIILETKNHKIEEIQIGKKPQIAQYGDTLYYNLDLFKDQTDRTIGEALRRLPGISTLDNGKVLFNGQEISGLLLDGDDLLEGKYGIGTRTIPAALVLGVEVIKNYEPRKVLQNVLVSNRVAINLKFKEDSKLKLNGEGIFGLGNDLNYNVEGNGILLKNKTKGLSSLKMNSVGNNLKNNSEDLINSQDQDIQNFLLSYGSGLTTSLPESRSFKNQSVGLFTHHLFKNKDESEFKVHLDLSYDPNFIQFDSESQLYDGNSYVILSENQYLKQKPFLTHGKISGKWNKESYYLENTLSYKTEIGKVVSHPESQINGRNLINNQSFHHIHNKLQYIYKFSNRNLLTIDIKTDGLIAPEDLAVPFDVFYPENSSDPALLTQNFQKKTILNSMELMYRHQSKWIPNISFSGNQEWIQGISNLSHNSVELDSIRTHLSGFNHLNFNKMMGKLNLFYFKQWHKFRVTIGAPLIYQELKFFNKTSENKGSDKYFGLLPNLNTFYTINADQSLEFNLGRSLGFTSFEDLLIEPVLKNPFVLSFGSGTIQQNVSWNANLNHSYANSMKLFFIKTHLYSRVTTSELYNSFKADGNYLQQEFIEKPNTFQQFGAGIEFQKLFIWKTLMPKIRLNWDHTETPQQINGEDFIGIYSKYSLHPSISAKINSKWNVEYFGQFLWNQTVSKNYKGVESLNAFSSILTNQGLSMTYKHNKNWNSSLSSQSYKMSRGKIESYQVMFFDANIQYNFSPWKAKFELTGKNLLDVKEFSTISYRGNWLTQQNYALRGRMILLNMYLTL